ncbi:MAG: sensor histidine kinase, partial [Inhella sp.]
PCTLELALEPGLEMHSHAGPIEQVLVNLIQNALMHGLESSGEAGRLRIEARRLSPGWLQMAVQDNGRGIDPEHLPRIFDPFFTTKLGRGGLGLGLVIVQSLARQLLGGQLRVHSKLGEGTRFELDMPEQAPSQPLNSQSAPL